MAGRPLRRARLNPGAPSRFSHLPPHVALWLEAAGSRGLYLENTDGSAWVGGPLMIVKGHPRASSVVARVELDSGGFRWSGGSVRWGSETPREAAAKLFDTVCPRAPGSRQNPDYRRMSQEDLVAAFLEGYERYKEAATRRGEALRVLDYADAAHGDVSRREFEAAATEAGKAMAAYMQIEPFLTPETKEKYLRPRAVAVVDREGDQHILPDPVVRRARLNPTQRMSEDRFVTLYQPETDANGDLYVQREWSSPGDRAVLEQAVAEQRTWSVVETDKGMYLLSGEHHVNRVYSIVTTVPHGGKDIEVRFS